MKSSHPVVSVETKELCLERPRVAEQQLTLSCPPEEKPMQIPFRSKDGEKRDSFNLPSYTQNFAARDVDLMHWYLLTMG